MNNHTILAMSLIEAKTKCEQAIAYWGDNDDKSIKPSELVESFHKKIQAMLDLDFDSGKYIIMKHQCGAIFPVIIPDGQLNSESWEGLSMAAAHTVFKELANNNPCWQTIYAAIDQAVVLENIEVNPRLVA